MKKNKKTKRSSRRAATRISAEATVHEALSELLIGMNALVAERVEKTGLQTSVVCEAAVAAIASQLVCENVPNRCDRVEAVMDCLTSLLNELAIAADPPADPNKGGKSNLTLVQ
jgi:hypothetical protein